ncbi:YdaS family helix-turn-helix protein [Serratia fonticola]|uniref:YdaS family helix-turn-helix protein n=1 Tax=Serratia fonticola TaxID=47917 RepID=A0AAJ1YHI0_SERFO|nr:YdaS family helix-turn-helix protein [Serratia fonticola]MDQ9129721.1 YdaS family helix-turn-helix protein [Serratia fonticola]
MNQIVEKAISIAGSQSELAKRVGVGQSTISKWLGGAEISSRYIPALVTATSSKITAEQILESLQPVDGGNSTAPTA